MDKRKSLILILLTLFSISVLLITPFLGMKSISISNIFQAGGDNLDFNIFWRIRLPRILTSFLAGAALALSGMAFQAMFRNPLATPFTLGVSSGAVLETGIGQPIGRHWQVGNVHRAKDGPGSGRGSLGKPLRVEVIHVWSRQRHRPKDRRGEWEQQQDDDEPAADPAKYS